jgi:uncharacterized damage-inducible protein DinB
VTVSDSTRIVRTGDSVVGRRIARRRRRFGQKCPKLAVLNINVTHSSEHRGNLVTYLRVKGLVPPSSASGQ